MTRTDVTPNASRAWQPGDRVQILESLCHKDEYRILRDRVGVIESVDESDPFSIVGFTANVRFEHPNFPKGILKTDVLYRHLCDSPEETEEEKQKRRSPLRLKEPKDNSTEADKQKVVVQNLNLMKYRVIETDTHRGKAICGKCSRLQERTVYGECPGCHGPVFSPSTGAEAGLPDLLVTHPVRWRGNIWFMVEMKRDEKADRRAEQVALAEAGLSIIAWSLPMVLHAIVAHEQRMGFISHPDALQYLERHGRMVAA